ncbi:integral membrane metal-binding family protein [Trifolium repens]|nr:integral membrane metal-binding family protein [Trifolium repens]
MGDDKVVGKTSSTTTGNEKNKRRGFISRIWNGIVRLHVNDSEKRLQYISKEEATVIARMTRRLRSRRHVSRNLIVFSVIFEVIVVGYAIMTTRSVSIDWKMWAIQVLPRFLLPALSAATYSAFTTFTRMWT